MTFRPVLKIEITVSAGDNGPEVYEIVSEVPDAPSDSSTSGAQTTLTSEQLRNQLIDFLTKSEQGINVISHQDSTTVILPDGRRAGVRARPTGVKLLSMRNSMGHLRFWVRSTEDFGAALAWLRQLPARHGR